MYCMCQSYLRTYVPYLSYVLVQCELPVLKLLCRNILNSPGVEYTATAVYNKERHFLHLLKLLSICDSNMVITLESPYMLMY